MKGTVQLHYACLKWVSLSGAGSSANTFRKQKWISSACKQADEAGADRASSGAGGGEVQWQTELSLSHRKPLCLTFNKQIDRCKKKRLNLDGSVCGWRLLWCMCEDTYLYTNLSIHPASLQPSVTSRVDAVLCCLQRAGRSERLWIVIMTERLWLQPWVWATCKMRLRFCWHTDTYMKIPYLVKNYDM